MHITVLKETKRGEARVAATPDTVRKYIALGAEVSVQSGAGKTSGFEDEAYGDAGAYIARSAEIALEHAQLLPVVNTPDKETLDLIPKGVYLVGMLNPYEREAEIRKLAMQHIHAFALELLPRISRAQSMDVLSSQSNLAGYRAVIDAFAESAKAAPMMMTAAGTVPPAKVLILGAGVAGLQAVATAKRIGAVVSVFDVRAAVKEQVESLGAKFIEVPRDTSESGESGGGYAKEMSDDYKQRQAQLIFDTIRLQDIVITTALIPGKPAPTLISDEMVEAMKPGSVIVDLAAVAGGNCTLTKLDKVVQHQGVTIIGHGDLPSRVAADASALYARNLYNFIATLMIKDGVFSIAWDDPLVKGTLLTYNGALVHPMFGEVAA